MLTDLAAVWTAKVWLSDNGVDTSHVHVVYTGGHHCKHLKLCQAALPCLSLCAVGADAAFLDVCTVLLHAEAVHAPCFLCFAMHAQLLMRLQPC